MDDNYRATLISFSVIRDNWDDNLLIFAINVACGV